MKSEMTFEKRLEIINARIYEIGRVFREIGTGFLKKDPALFRFLKATLLILLVIFFKIDMLLFKRFHIWWMYPPDGIWFRAYVFFWIVMPTIAFGVMMKARKDAFAKKLKSIFEVVGLKNAIGTCPRFLNLEEISGGTMKLKMTNGSFTLDDWNKKRDRLGTILRVFIDEIEANQEKGTIDMTFSYEPMPSKVTIENIKAFRDYKFMIGRDRTKTFVGDFADSPHLLVGGESGGGKSFFNRQLITTIKINHPEAQFHIADLKGGVDFGYLEKLPGIKVMTTVESVAASLKTISANIDVRIQALKDRNHTDIKQFFTSENYRRMTTEERTAHTIGHRVFVLVDECAEIFLFGLGHDAAHTREIRGAMSRITRLGRAVGVHVILATQRPDKNAVDPQVRTNMTSIVCYRISDLGGSLAILGNGRATNLPKAPGRAILRKGNEEFEIQTPLLEFAESKRLLEEAFKVNLDTGNIEASNETKTVEVGDDKANEVQNKKTNEPDSLK